MARVRPSAQTMKAECQVTGPGARKTSVGIAADLALAGEGDPAVDAELLEQGGGLFDLFLDEGHAFPPVISWRSASAS